MRLMYVILTFILVASFGANLNAQERNCAAMNHLEQEISTNPERINTINAIEEHTQRFIANGATVSNRSVITIPIVFHVVYRTSAENISDAQLMSQLQVLNDDFRRLNSDADNTWSQAADAEIEFCLATVDPNGNPTTGITRTSTSVNGFGTNDQVKYTSQGGKDAWPRNDYLNFWVCNIGGGILGYAQFPGGAAATDGVVNDYRYTGSGGSAVAPFDLGRTATHEVGHWLNLRHIWGDGGCGVDDFVSDTPTSDASNGGCSTGHVSCGTVDMVQNYMDYSNDACMNLFTQGQKARMQALFSSGGARVSLLSSNGCNGGGGGGGGCTDTEVVVTINSDNYGSETTWTVTNSSGQVVASGGPYGNNATNTETLCLANDCYDFQINDSYGDGICCSYGNGSYSVMSGGSTLASGGEFGSSETTNFCIGGGSGPTCTDGIQNGDEEGVDCGGSNCAACPPPPCTDITLSLTFDNYASETSWQITNSGGGVIGSGSGYNNGDNNQTITLSGCLDADCYTFTINDSYGDGICCSYGNGSYSITDGAGTVLISGGQFGSSESKQFCVGGATRVDESARQETAITAEDKTWEVTKLYPNPVTNQLFIDYVADIDEEIQVTVFDILGKVIIERNQMLHAGYNKLQLDVTRLEAGYHLVKIQQGETQFTQKFIKH